MRFVTVVNNNAYVRGGISRFAFTAAKSIYDCELILESRGYKRLVVELDFISKGIKKCLRVAKGKITITYGSAYGPVLKLSENDMFAIMLSTINLNNLILNVDHNMRGDSIHDFNSEYSYVLSDYLKLMTFIMRSAK